MLDEICANIHNWFCDADDIRAGAFAIEGGALALDFLAEGQYFRIVGSLFNDGVYTYPAEGLTDETFDGEVWPMRPPKAFVALCAEIEAWQDKYGAVMASPYQSESVIGVYSYTKAATGSGGSGSGGWESAFRGKLNRWRKLS